MNPVNSINSTNLSPLELLNLYYSDGQSLGNRENKLWRKMNSLLLWDNILNKGYQSDLCPLLYYIITKHEHFPMTQRLYDPMTQKPYDTEVNDILLRLKKEYQWSLARNMILFDELGRVLEAFNEAGIDVIVLKGAALAQTIYPDIALRPMGDVDLLVKKEGLEKAENLLIQTQ